MRFIGALPAFKEKKVSNTGAEKLQLQIIDAGLLKTSVLGWKIKFQAQNYTTRFFMPTKSLTSRDICKLGGD